MKGSRSRSLVDGDVRKLLTSLTIPMIFGMLGVVAFNIADTWFVGKLGTVPLAALTYTFPVVFVLNSINLGLGVGTSTVISRAFGKGDMWKVKRLATDSLAMGLLFSLITAVAGEFTIDPLFTMLGADETVLPYIREYMTIWYAGAPFIVIPMLGNSAIRALGDTKIPGIVMMVSAITNIALDPLLIFGYGPIPALGVKGAAIATVISRAITFGVALYVLTVREKVITLAKTESSVIYKSWKAILYIGVPNALAKSIIPVGAGIITGLISSYGKEAVAGYGVATRVEFLALTVVMALSSVIPVFVGQNFGAGKLSRIDKGVKLSERFSVLSGVVLHGVLALCAPLIASLFTSDQAVAEVVVLYLRIVPAGYALQGVLMILNGAFNAVNQPLMASGLIVLQMIVIYVPLAIWSSSMFGITGIFGALLFSIFLVAAIGHTEFNRSLKKLRKVQ